MASKGFAAEKLGMGVGSGSSYASSTNYSQGFAAEKLGMGLGSGSSSTNYPSSSYQSKPKTDSIFAHNFSTTDTKTNSSKTRAAADYVFANKGSGGAAARPSWQSKAAGSLLR